MRTHKAKQLTLKPQDLFVVLKLAVSRNAPHSFSGLAMALSMSASEVHAAFRRATLCHLIESEDGAPVVNRAALQEFMFHGVRYVFPAITGPVTRGVPTGAFAPVLRAHFEQADTMPMVWPDPEGEVRGTAILPLYPTVPYASRIDPKLYDALSLLDALRGGAAREREMARGLLMGLML
jgi:hypothetical protein